jgi:hypothetical protein
MTTIGSLAFWNCTGLVSIDLPNSLTSLGNGALQSCTGLTSITIPDGVTVIRDATFYNCQALTTVHLPEKVTTIENNAFSTCPRLTSILLPRTVTAIGAQAFYCCTALASITNLNPTPQSINSNVFEGHFIAGPAVDKTTCVLKVPASSLDAYQTADVWKDFLNITGGMALTVVKNRQTGSLSGMATGIYDSGAAVSVTATPFADYDFYGWLANEDTLTIDPALSFTLVQDTVITAHFGKFSHYTLTEAGTLKNIAGIKASTTLMLSGTIDARDIQFMRDSMPTLETLDLSRATIVSYIGTEGTDYGTYVGYFADAIPNYSFCRYNYNNSYYEYIGKASIRSVKLPAAITSIGSYAFNYCTGLLSIELPNGLQRIDQSAFMGCSNLPEITLPPSLTYIGYYVFMNCTKITSFILPAGLTTISPFAFWNCTGLTSLVNLNPTPVSITSDVFLGVTQSAVQLKVPSGSLNAYKSAAVWRNFLVTGGIALTISVNNEVLGSVSGATSGIYNNGTTLQLTAHPAAGYEFLRWTSGETVLSTTPELTLTLTQDTEVTAHFAKTGSYTLTEVNTLKDVAGIKEITHLTLSGYIDARDVQFMRDSMPNLTELDLTDATVVAYSGTDGTQYGSNVIYPANQMPGYSFYNYTTGKHTLLSVKLPAGLTSIGNAGFYGCNNLVSVSFPSGLTKILNSAFGECGLRTIILPASVTTIGPGAFLRLRLVSITSLNPTPVSLRSSDNVFLHVNTAACTLKVATTSVAAYQAAEVWKDFYVIGGGRLFSATASNPRLGHISGTANGLYPDGTAISVTATPFSGYEFIQWTSGETVLATTPELSLTLTQDTEVTAHFVKSGSYTLTEAGTLKDIAGIKEITHLTLSGYIDARDVQFMRDSMPYLAGLDLAAATVVAYSGTEGTYAGASFNYSANEMPFFSFYNHVTGSGKSSLISVKLPAGLTVIGSMGFFNCNNLVSVSFPPGLTDILGNAFESCKLRTITLPASVKAIGSGAFSRCTQLVSITNLNPTPISLLNSNNIFQNVNTAACTLTVPTASVAAYQAAEVWKDFYVTGGGRLFTTKVNDPRYGSLSAAAEGLYPDGTAISVTATPFSGYEFIQWTSGGSVLSTMPELTLTLTQDTEVTAYFGKPGSYTLTEAGTLKEKSGIKTITFLKLSGNIDARDVQFMRDSMPNLAELDLTAATIVTYSGTEGTFYGKDTLYPDHTLPQLSFCTGNLQPKLSLKSVALPTSLTAIGRITFTYCTNLTTVIIPEGIVSIEYAAFYSSGITGVLHLPSLRTIGDLAFTACPGITGALHLPDGITSIGTAVFQNCYGLTSLRLPAQLTSIGDYAFASCFAMSGPLVIPSGVTTIGQFAFTNCKFTGTLELPPALTSIGTSAFNLLAVTSLTLPASLTSIGSAAFMQCSNLAVITNLNSTPVSITADVFQSVDKIACELKVPTTALAAYQAAPVWQDFLQISGAGFTVNATANNNTYGSASGSGLYAANTTASVSATAFSGYKFVNWTSGGNEVSAANPYSFSVTQDITLVANFIAKSNDANLQTLTVSAGTLEPAFNAATTSYTVSVANNISAITLSATAAHSSASVSGDVGNRTLQVGANTFTITVTAEDGATTKNYTVVVSRADAPVTLTAVSLNGGVFVAVFRTVDLSFSFTGGSPTHFMAGETADLSGAAWQTYMPGALTYTLASDAIGNKTVYAKLKNEVSETTVVSDVVYYKPLHAKLSLTAFGISNGATYATQREVTLNHTVENGVPTHYSVSEKREQVGRVWFPYVPEPVYTLSGQHGFKEIFFAVANATDTSGTVSDGIYLDESVTLASHGLTASLFPNPTGNVLHVVIEDETITSVQVTVYTITGGVYLSQTYLSRFFDIDMSRYPSGTGIVKLSGEKGYVIKQIIKN